jgi:selenocysteine lyase/cysteine desulfurase
MLTGSLLTGAALQAGAALTAVPAESFVRPAGADDEAAWTRIAGHYGVARDVVQLENGNFGIMARPVLAAYTRHTERVNEQGSYYTRRGYAADAGRILQSAAALLGVSADELVFTRNATEALQALIGGYNRLRPGDAVLYADLDYDSMQTAMRWLRSRRGADVVTINLPEPATHQGLIDAYEQALQANPRIRLLLLTHVSHRTGLMLPLAEIIAMARARGVDAIVDAAHSWGQADFNFAALQADFVGFNAHKWLGAPLGVGLAYIRKSRVADIDAFMGNDEYGDPLDVRNRVHTGTANFAAVLSFGDALDWHRTLGPSAKAARLKYLRDCWAETLRGYGQLQVLTPEDARLSAGITSFRMRGRTSMADNAAVGRQLLEQFGVFTVARSGVAAGACVRVTPALFTLRAEMDVLTQALKVMAAAP